MLMLDIQLDEKEAAIIGTVLGAVKFRLGIKYPKLFRGRHYRRLHLNDATADTMGHIGRRLHKHSSDGVAIAGKLGIPTAVKKKDFIQARKDEGATPKQANAAWKAWKGNNG